MWPAPERGDALPGGLAADAAAAARTLQRLRAKRAAVENRTRLLSPTGGDDVFALQAALQADAAAAARRNAAMRSAARQAVAQCAPPPSPTPRDSDVMKARGAAIS